MAIPPASVASAAAGRSMPPISISNSVVGSAPAVVILRPLPPPIAPPLVLMLVVVVILVRIIREERLIFLGIADDVLDDLPEQPGRHSCSSLYI